MQAARRIRWSGWAIVAVPIVALWANVFTGIDGRHWLAHTVAAAVAVALVVGLLLLGLAYGRWLGWLGALGFLIAVLGVVAIVWGNLTVVAEEGRTQQTDVQAHAREAGQSDRWNRGHAVADQGYLAVGLGSIIAAAGAWRSRRLTGARAAVPVVASLAPQAVLLGLGWAMLPVLLSLEPPSTASSRARMTT
jgi:hypothetical protein